MAEDLESIVTRAKQQQDNRSAGQAGKEKGIIRENFNLDAKLLEGTVLPLLLSAATYFKDFGVKLTISPKLEMDEVSLSRPVISCGLSKLGSRRQDGQLIRSAEGFFFVKDGIVLAHLSTQFGSRPEAAAQMPEHATVETLVEHTIKALEKSLDDETERLSYS